MPAFRSTIALHVRDWHGWCRAVGLLVGSLAAAWGGLPSASAGDVLLGEACCFSRRVGLDCCSPTCPGPLCSGCGYRHPVRWRGGGDTCAAAGKSDGEMSGGPAGEFGTPGGELGPEASPLAEDQTAAPPDAGFESVAASFGASARSADVLPSMVGDFFGGGINVFVPSLRGNDSLATTVLPVAGGDRRYKLAENNSPFPADRAFFNYHYFKNAIQDVDSRQGSLDRYTFGLEKTFLAGRWSVEARIPFAQGLDSTQMADTAGLNSATEFGNIPLVLKHLLVQRERWAAAAGVALTLPTAADAVITDGVSSLVVENEAYHLQPFLGFYLNPSERLWTVLFVQADFDANGNTTTFSGPAFQGSSNQPGRGVLQDQNALYLDAACGYWMYRNSCPHAWLSGIAPLLELHYSTTMQDGDIVIAPNGFDAVGGMTLDFDQPGPSGPAASRRLDVLNLTAALRFQFAQRSMLTIAGVAPLRSGEDQLFDAELGVQYVWSY